MTGIVILPAGTPDGTMVARQPDVVIVAGDPPQSLAIASGKQGPAGIQGPIGPSGGSALSAVAGEPLGGQRVVYMAPSGLAFYASNQTAAHGLIALGVTLGAAILGSPVDILRAGDIVEPSWSWTLDEPVYLGNNGLLTQVPPVGPAVFQRIIGFPIASDRLYISFREPIYLI